PNKPIKNVEFSIVLHLGGRDVLTADFDVGLDALAFQFSTTGGVELSWDYSLDFGIGVNLLDGFFFQLNENTHYTSAGLPKDSAGKPEISLDAHVRLLPNASLQTKLFFLNLTATANAVEDYNGDGIINDGGTGEDDKGRLHGPKLDEVADDVDYNRDGDKTDR